jgi:hypothetical protein
VWHRSEEREVVGGHETCPTQQQQQQQQQQPAPGPTAFIAMLMKNSRTIWLLIGLLYTLGKCEATATGPNTLSVYALNANGMVHAGKVSQISSIVKTRRPHILVISETKTYDKVGKKLNTTDYNFFEETGVKMDNH